ncbi:copii-coated vesicle protein [Mucor ambiguus]|uniref:Copii-coated vesicle protein n=1 Tax=Mucor ambiguus TaxID=91626 RepID=A0A0C9M2U8_9FUNG|nr:copii-coated vesicle protein [Mucor ambiguus]
MYTRLVVLFLAMVCLLKTILAMSIDIQPHENECFYEELEKGDKLSVTFQVGQGGNLDIDFWISDPDDNVLVSTTKKTQSSKSVTANTAGRYTYCFSNKISTVSAKSVNFNANINLKNEVNENNEEDPLKNEIEELADSILAVKAEQEYIVARERRHRDTAESTNTRVKWWSVAQIALLIVVCFWQVHYLKHFFEVKRAV